MAIDRQETEDRFRIAPKELQPRVEVLKEGEMFLTALPDGSIWEGDLSGLGLFYRDTRFLNRLLFYLEEFEPLLLSSLIRESHFAQIELTNREFHLPNGVLLPLQSIHFRITRVLKNGLYQRLRIINFNSFPVTINLTFSAGADYVDIFEVRGTTRRNRGRLLPVCQKSNGFTFGYEGLDHFFRSTDLTFYPDPNQIWVEGDKGFARYSLTLEPHKKYFLYLQIVPSINLKINCEEDTYAKKKEMSIGFSKAAINLNKDYLNWQRQCTKIETNNEIINQMINQAVTDLRALISEYPESGKIIEAGIPWYAAPFGRDSLITSWQTLILNQEIAKNTLRFLAHYQGRNHDAWKDEQPGKILHEIRRGEMALNHEVPHTPYYGTVDATPWFIIVLGETFRWTHDEKLLKELAEPLKKALYWCEKYGDIDGDGFIEYLRQSESGLLNQGWKDSWDGVIDRDGSLPEGPIALVEVQAYYYLALLRGSELLQYLGEIEEALRLRRKALKLQAKFIKAFWIEEEGFLGFALDGKKRLLKTTVSNPGHALFTGILPAKLAQRVAERLFRQDMYSGWGIRTMSAKEKPYNPMSYHNGSVWPHENSIIARGLKEVGQEILLEKLVNDLVEAARFFNYYRWPELFCGFTRRANGGPVRYPIACDPQAWAVGSVFIFLQSILGIFCDGGDIRIVKPTLPGWLSEVYLENLKVGKGAVDLEFSRSRGKTYCNVVKREGEVKVLIEP